jgi:ferric-dicitrate binding protein FerR (iron transport regulator)
MPARTPKQLPEQPRQHERRRQLRGLLLIAAAVLLFSLLRAHHVFTPGWWRLW